jgi:hypothetical protein
MSLRRGVGGGALVALLLACAGGPGEPALSLEEARARVRPGTPEAEAWAAAALAAPQAAERPRDAHHLCQVFALIEQESGYQADPEVPGLAALVEAELMAQARDKLGFLGPKALDLVLDVTPEGGTRSFRAQLRAVRTERDLDLLFRALLAHHEARAPMLGAALRRLFPAVVDRLNPVGTVGSMQVAVAWAAAQPAARGLSREALRDRLYSLEGGVLFGTLRLFAHEADYDRVAYRMADYNAGLYASRNTAFQLRLRLLSGRPVDADGDLLVYDPRGRPSDQDGQTVQALLAWRAAHAPDLPEAQLRADLRREKERSFEETETWARTRADWSARRPDDPPDYARIPDVRLDSPKLRADLTTKWFAEKVESRHAACMARG